MKDRNPGRNLKIGWLGGFAGGTFWILILGIVRFFQGSNYRALLWTACFLICVEIVWMVLPWRRPEVRLRRLYIAAVTPIVLTALLMLAINALAEGTAIWTTLPGLAILYLPAFTLGGKTWRDLSGEEPEREGGEG